MEYAATCVLTVGHDELGVGDDDDASLVACHVKRTSVGSRG